MSLIETADDLSEFATARIPDVARKIGMKPQKLLHLMDVNRVPLIQFSERDRRIRLVDLATIYANQARRATEKKP